MKFSCRSISKELLNDHMGSGFSVTSDLLQEPAFGMHLVSANHKISGSLSVALKKIMGFLPQSLHANVKTFSPVKFNPTTTRCLGAFVQTTSHLLADLLSYSVLGQTRLNQIIKQSFSSHRQLYVPDIIPESSRYSLDKFLPFSLSHRGLWRCMP